MLLNQINMLLRSALFALLLMLGCSVVYAQADNPEEAVEIAKARHGGGKVLGVRRKSRDDGSTYYEVKLLTNGEVSIYKIDSR